MTRITHRALFSNDPKTALIGPPSWARTPCNSFGPPWFSDVPPDRRGVRNPASIGSRSLGGLDARPRSALETFGGRHDEVVPLAEVRDVVRLWYRLLAAPHHHLGLAQKEPTLLVGGRVLEHPSDRGHQTYRDGWHPPARLADLVERPTDDPFEVRGRLDEPHLPIPVQVQA